MSIVAVHGPNTFGVKGAGTGGSGGQVITDPSGQIKVTANLTDGYVFTVEPVNTQRAAADYDWVLTGSTTPTKADTKTPFTVTYTSAGLKTISLTIAAGAGPPPGGTYNINVTAAAGPRSVEPDGEEGEPQSLAAGSEPPVEAGAYDPGEHTVDEVKDYVTAHLDEAGEIYDAEYDGKQRTTLLDWLETQIPYDPGAHTVTEVIGYVEENPDKLEEVLAAEQAGKARSTLISQLEYLRPA